MTISILDGFTFDDIEYLVDNNPYLRGYLHGYLAELVLLRTLENTPGVDSVSKIPDKDDRKGDLEVVYKGALITIECKSVGSSTVKDDHQHDSWTGSVVVKNSDRRTIVVDDESFSLTNLRKGTFDILGVNCFAVNNQWNFLFIENKYLPEHDDIPGLITTKFTINPRFTPCITDDLEGILEKVYLQKINQAC